MRLMVVFVAYAAFALLGGVVWSWVSLPWEGDEKDGEDDNEGDRLALACAPKTQARRDIERTLTPQ